MSHPSLVFDPRPSRMALPAVAGRLGLDPRLPGVTPLRLAEMPAPRVPGPGWAVVRPRWTGVCGSDVVQAFVRVAWDNPLSAVTSFPHVPGHEVVGEIADPGEPLPGAPDDLPAGALVAVDPWLGCEVRGADPPCAGCAAGSPALCARHGEPAPGGNGRGMHLGHIAGLPGGFGPLMVVHRSRLHRLPEALLADPAAAVLADPLAVAVHAVDVLCLEGRPRAEGPLLVLGAGTIGLCVAAVLRRRLPDAEVLVTAAWPHTADAVRELGATPLPAGAAAVVEEVGRRTGERARTQRPWSGAPWLAGGGAAGIVDAVGSAATVETALRAAAPRTRIVTVGVHRPERTETTLAYVKELTLAGSNGYGRGPRGAHHLDEALALLAGDGAVPHARWRTATFPLSAWRQAFTAAARPGASGSIKVTIEQGGSRR